MLRWLTAGESHGQQLTAILEGLPAGVRVQTTDLDAQLSRLAGLLPPDTSLHITADHGMVDVPLDARPDIAEEPELDAGLRHVSGEPRCLQLHRQACA